MATSLMTLSGVLGEISSLGLTPLLVDSAARVPYMNIMWFIPGLIGSIISVCQVRSDKPPSSPSLSAEAEMKKEKGNWISSIKQLLNVQFITICTILGIFLGFNSCIITKMEQLLCARGYSDQFAGLITSLYLTFGIVMSVPLGILVTKTGKSVLITKISIALTIFGAGGLGLLALTPDNHAALVFFSIVCGSFSISVFPCMLELVAETTYPVNQATSTALIYLSSGIHGSLMLAVEMKLKEPLQEEEMAIQTCSAIDDKSHETAMDYSFYVYFVQAYTAAAGLGYIFGFFPELKRTKADRIRLHSEHVEA